MKLYKTKRLVADIPEDFHKEVKIQAAFRGINIQQYVMQAVAEKMAREKKYQ